MWIGHQNDLCRTYHIPHNSCYLLRFAKDVQKALIKSATYFYATTMPVFAPWLSGSPAFSEKFSVWAIGFSHWSQCNVCAKSGIEKFHTPVLFFKTAGVD